MKLNGIDDISVSQFNSATTELNYDLGFYCIGFEKRSRFIAQSWQMNVDSLVGFKYPTYALAAPDNLNWSESVGATIVDLAHGNDASDYRSDNHGVYKTLISDKVASLSQKTNELKVFFDISSADRSLTARVILACIECLPRPFSLDLLYAPATFVEPSYEFVPLKECAPAIPELAGPIGLQSGHTNLVLGVGFEFGVSLDLMQRFEPDETLLYFPTGGDPRYESAVKRSNFDFSFGPDLVRILPYNVYQPLATFHSLFAVAEIGRAGRGLLVAPNGPKIFGALGVLVGLLRGGGITVLRSSQFSLPPLHHVEAEGKIVGITLKGGAWY